MEKDSLDQSNQFSELEQDTDQCDLSSIPSAAYKDVSHNSDDDELGEEFDLTKATANLPESADEKADSMSTDQAPPRRPSAKKGSRRESGSPRKRSVGPDIANQTQESESGVRQSLEARPSGLDRQLLAAAAAGNATEIRALVARGADPDARQGDAAALRALHLAALSGHPEAVDALLELGAPLARKSGTDDSALHYAAEAGRVRAGPVSPAHPAAR